VQQPRDDEWRVTFWAEWVSLGVDSEARRNRLDSVPVALRDVVRQEVQWHFAKRRALNNYRSSAGNA